MGNKEVSAALWKKLKPLVPQPPPRSAKGGRRAIALATAPIEW
jgi:hypothetical protein